MPQYTLSQVVLVLAPFGRDSSLATRLLDDAGVKALACGDLGELLGKLREGAGAALITEDAVRNADLAPLSEWLQSQPSWSDFPFVLLTTKGGAEQQIEALRLMEIIGNITFLERPFYPTTLVSVVKSALRSRQRQYDTRTHLSELEQSADQLMQSEERRRVAVEGAGIGTWDFYPDSGTLIWDPVCRRLFGIGENADLDLDTCMALIHQDDQARVGEAIGNAIKPGFTGLYKTEFRLADTSAGERWLVVFGKLYPSVEHGRRLAGSALDITERKRAEEGLRDRAESLEAQVEERTRERDRMWQLSSELLMVADFDGKIIAANPSWERIFGWPEIDLRNRSFLDFVHPDDIEHTVAETASLSGGKKTFRFRNRYRHRDGSYSWISWTAVPASGYIYGTGRDITEELNKTEALRQAEEQLRQAQKMEAVGQLTGGIAHDFNNLLAGIGGSLEMTQIRIKQGRTADLDKYLAAASASVQRAAALTHRLLAFSRRQTLDPKPTDVNALIASMEDLIQRSTGPTIEFKLGLTEGIWSTRCDPHQLESALLNLAINARDAMPNGGKLFVETSNTELDEAYTSMQDELKSGDYIAISVTDTGEGMPPDVAARAFDPFFTTKPLGQGTGLGLSMVYGFVKQSGGHVRIYSEPGNGTTVTIFLPRDKVTSNKVHQAEIHREALEPGHGETILVVDDEMLIRALVAESLQDAGYTILEAENGPSALRVLEANPGLDMLVTDVGLPQGMNGRQLADAARQKLPNLKVLFITGYAAQAAVENSLIGEGMEVLTKPFPIDALAAKVKTMLSAPGVLS